MVSVQTITVVVATAVTSDGQHINFKLQWLLLMVSVLTKATSWEGYILLTNAKNAPTMCLVEIMRCWVINQIHLSSSLETYQDTQVISYSVYRFVMAHLWACLVTSYCCCKKN